MSTQNVNVVVITGNLTRDPDLRYSSGGSAICEMRVAVNGRRKDQSGTWVDKPNYLNVVAFGSQGENAAKYLEKGRPVAIEGRLDWREWDAKDGGHREAVQVIAGSVQYLGSRPKGEEAEGASEPQATPVPDVDVLEASDEELLKLTRPQLDALAASEEVENPEEYATKADVVDAIREEVSYRV